MMLEYSLIALLSPLFGGIMAAFLGKSFGKNFVNLVTIIGVSISFVLSCIIALEILETSAVINQNIYTWLNIGDQSFHIGLLIDNLTASMMVVVTFVSLMVHVYTIGYMHDDPGYHRFFSYISLFTFSMLSLVMSNNFLQLFFGWEAVGVMSYLLIGFWYTKESAIKANLKAFIVNRVGDLSLILGIGIIFSITGSLDYYAVFSNSQEIAQTELLLTSTLTVSALTAACILLFGGAMGKSAQMPLHVWLPDSMEGPTPISALIHAATMVTAGVFLLARMSPLFELSTTALSFVLIIGATTALFTGILGLIQNDIKRVVAYSTLSQLGYMVAAAGVSAYSASLFHLMTHAFFKALLFLAAGSVIVALHHEQDIRKMGGLKNKLPITYVTSLIGSLALIGFPGFSGFFSKDALIEAIGHADIIGSGFAYASVLIGVFITALYTFRLFFTVFHGALDEHHHDVKESPLSITLPLVLLAIPSVIIAWPTVGPMVFGSYFANAILQPDAYQIFGYEFTSAYGFLIHAFSSPVIYIALLGVAIAYILYIQKPGILHDETYKSSFIYRLLDNKYYFDDLYENVFAKQARNIGDLLWKVGDIKTIDNFIVNGTAYRIGNIANRIKGIQTGYIYHYALMMILGLAIFLAWTILDLGGAS